MVLFANTCSKKKFIADFQDFVLRPIKKFKKIICIVQNERSFDSQFILKHLFENYKFSWKNPNVVSNGTKILSMDVRKTCFIDNLNYIQVALSALPTAFSLTGVGKKEYSPTYSMFPKIKIMMGLKILFSRFHISIYDR